MQKRIDGFAQLRRKMRVLRAVCMRQKILCRRAFLKLRKHHGKRVASAPLCPLRLAADGGIFSLTESGEETPFFEGQGSTKARGKFTVRWEIPMPEREKVYTFSVGANGKATAKLWYDAQNSAWILEKETN